MYSMEIPAHCDVVLGVEKTTFWSKEQWCSWLSRLRWTGVARNAWA